MISSAKRQRPLRCAWWAGLACVLLVGCQKTLEGVVDDARPGASAGVERVEVALKNIADSDDPKLATGVVSDAALHVGEDAAADTVVVFVEDGAVRGELGNVYGRPRLATIVPRCAALLDHLQWPNEDVDTSWTDTVIATAKRELSVCARSKFALVVRTVAFAAPRIDASYLETRGDANHGAAPKPASTIPTSAAPSAKPSAAGMPSAAVPRASAMPNAKLSTSAAPSATPPASSSPSTTPLVELPLVEAPKPTFDIRGATLRDLGCASGCAIRGAYVRAEVHVVQLSPYKDLGAFEVVATSSAHVDFTAGAATETHNVWMPPLEADLGHQFMLALASAARTHLPAAVFP